MHCSLPACVCVGVNLCVCVCYFARTTERMKENTRENTFVSMNMLSTFPYSPTLKTYTRTRGRLREKEGENAREYEREHVCVCVYVFVRRFRAYTDPFRECKRIRERTRFLRVIHGENKFVCVFMCSCIGF